LFLVEASYLQTTVAQVFNARTPMLDMVLIIPELPSMTENFTAFAGLPAIRITMQSVLPELAP
jgi:hypothetical protein